MCRVLPFSKQPCFHMLAALGLRFWQVAVQAAMAQLWQGWFHQILSEALALKARSMSNSAGLSNFRLKCMSYQTNAMRLCFAGLYILDGENWWGCFRYCLRPGTPIGQRSART